MPPFQYEKYSNPYVSSLSALMQAPGQIEAQRATAVAQAQAQAAQASGQAWSGAAQNIAQGVTGAVQQATDPRRKLEAIQLQEAQARVLDMKAMDAAYAKPGGRAAILAALPGHLKPTVQAQFDSSDKAHADAQKAQEDADRLATDAFADTGAAIKSHGYDPTSAQLAISDLKAKYQGNPSRLAQLQQAEAAIQKNPTPQTVQALVDPLIQASPKRVQLEQSAATHAETIRHNQESERISKLTQDRTAATAAEAARHNGVLETIAQGNLKREQAAQAETVRHDKATEAAANPLAMMTGGQVGASGGVSNVHGDDFLKTLPPPLAGEIKAYAEGRRPFPTGMSMAKLQPLIQAVGQYDPTFDAANYNARAKARVDLTNPGGAGGKIVNSMNTALQHLGKLSDLIEALDNGDTPAVNAVANWFSKQTGSSKVTNFEAVQPQAMKEIERLWRGAGGSEGDIAALKDSLSKNMGRQQQREALSQFAELLKGKLDSTEQQRDNILGPAAKDVPILFKQNEGVLEKIGQRAGGGGASQPSVAVGKIVNVKGQKITVTAVHADGTFDGDPVK